MADNTDMDLDDFSLLDLFLSEVESHMTTLEEGISALEKDLNVAEMLDSVIRSFHSIKGGARIVELDPAAKIAETLEAFFTGVREKKFVLPAESYPTFYQARNLLRQIFDAAGRGDDDWEKQFENDLKNLISEISSLSSQKSTAPPPKKTQEQSQRIQSKKVVKPEVIPQKISAADIPFSHPCFLDESLCQLFKTEMKTLTEELNDIIFSLKQNPGNRQDLDAFIRGLHSIKGGARIVEMQDIETLAVAMEKHICAIRDRRVEPAPDHFNILGIALDTIDQMTNVAGEQFDNWIKTNRDNVDIIMAELSSADALSQVSIDIKEQTAPAEKIEQDVTQSIVLPVEEGIPEESVPDKSEEAAPSEYPEEVPEINDPSRITISPVKFNRLKELGAEVVSAVNRIASFAESYHILEQNYKELATVLERLQAKASYSEAERAVNELIYQGNDMVKECQLYLESRVKSFDQKLLGLGSLSDRLYHELMAIRSDPQTGNNRQLQQGKAQILVVDDSITAREMATKQLENSGYQVDVAVDGVDGWNSIRINPYHLVVSDIDMPGMNGLDLLKKIRKHPILKTTTVIIVTHRDSERDREIGMEAGANDYLSKASYLDASFIDTIKKHLDHVENADAETL